MGAKAEMKKNMHGVELQTPEERMAELKETICRQLEGLMQINECNASAERGEIEAVALVNFFRRKATVMREIERSAADYLDRYDRREGHE